MGILVTYDFNEGLLAEPCTTLQTAMDLCAANWDVDTVEITDDVRQVKIYTRTARGVYMDALFLPESSLP